MKSKLMVLFVLFFLIFVFRPVAEGAMSEVDFANLCQTGTIGEIKEAVASGIDLNAKNSHGETIFMRVVARVSNPTVIKELIKSGADVNSQSYSRGTPLFAAARNNANPKIASTLIEAGANVNALNDEGWTVLMRAAYFNPNPEVAAVLLRAGVDPNAKNNNGDTALTLAQNKNPGVYKRLHELIKNANNTPDFNAALTNAEQAGPMAQYMLGQRYEKGDGTSKNLTEAARCYEKAAAMGLPIAQNRLGEMYRDGIGVSKNTKRAAELFQLAAKAGYLPASAKFVDIMAGEFTKICMEGNISQIETALANGVDVNVRDSNGNTPLILVASDAQKPNVVSVLLKAGADVDAQNEDGVTALIYAVMKNPEIAEMLIDAGADSNIRDNKNKRASDYVAANAAFNGTRLYRRLRLHDVQSANKSVNADSIFSQGTRAYDSKNYKRAFELFSKAADAGHVWSAIKLGEMYFNAEGVKKDDAVAFYWMRMGAEEGHARTQYNLGYLYETGQGTQPDTTEAMYWYMQAAKNGYVEANDAIRALGGTPPTSVATSGGSGQSQTENAIDFSVLKSK